MYDIVIIKNLSTDFSNEWDTDETINHSSISLISSIFTYRYLLDVNIVYE